MPYDNLTIICFILISIGYIEIDQIIKVLLSTNMFVAGLFGCIFDNTVPGTLEERGMIKWRKHDTDDNTTADNSNSERQVYDLPWCLSRVSKWKGSKYIPFLPYYPSSPPDMHGNTGSTTSF